MPTHRPAATPLDAIHAAVRRRLPTFDALRRAAAWPGPLARARVRRLALGGVSAGAVVAAYRLLERDDRAFCRGLRLEGWREASNVPDEEPVIFRLEDESGVLWPLAFRALVLFAGAEVPIDPDSGPDVRRRVLPPDAPAPAPDTVPHTFLVRTEPLPHAARESRGAGFRLALRRPNASAHAPS